jgi:histone acetyltransferase (RNA polymerase elongator complex component)
LESKIVIDYEVIILLMKGSDIYLADSAIVKISYDTVLEFHEGWSEAMEDLRQQAVNSMRRKGYQCRLDQVRFSRITVVKEFITSNDDDATDIMNLPESE